MAGISGLKKAPNLLNTILYSSSCLWWQGIQLALSSSMLVYSHSRYMKFEALLIWHKQVHAWYGHVKNSIYFNQQNLLVSAHSECISHQCCGYCFVLKSFQNKAHGIQKGMFNVQSCLLINFRYTPISLQSSWVSAEQPIRIDWLLYKHHREFPINEKIIPMLHVCPNKDLPAKSLRIHQIQDILWYGKLLVSYYLW